jgi:hypothetical protein
MRSICVRWLTLSLDMSLGSLYRPSRPRKGSSKSTTRLPLSVIAEELVLCISRMRMVR